MNLEYKPIIPDKENPAELSDRFSLFLDEIKVYYTPELIEKFISWHDSESLTEKIDDPTRFFRVIRDELWNIIAYFESKRHHDESMNDIQVIQWFFVHEWYRNQWALKSMWKEFVGWCEKNGYRYIWSYTALQNKVSQDVHASLFSERDIVDIGFGPVHWYRKDLK